MLVKGFRATRSMSYLKAAALGAAVVVAVSTPVAAQQGNAYGLGRPAAVANLPEGMAEMVSTSALDDLSVPLDKLDRFSHVGEQRAGYQMIVVDRHTVAPHFIEDFLDRQAHAAAGADVLDELHLDVAGQKRKWNLLEFRRRPAAGPNRIFPDVDDLLAQSRVPNLVQLRE